jgi:hypothetical protein
MDTRVRAMEAGGGNWSLWRLWRDVVGRMHTCAEEQSGIERQRRGGEVLGGGLDEACAQVPVATAALLVVKLLGSVGGDKTA